MAKFLDLASAVSEMVRDGDTVAMEGFTHLIPFAAGHEVIRQKKRDLTLIRMTPDLIYDQLIGMGCAKKLVFSWGGNPGVGSTHRIRDAVENGWPNQLAIEEHSHAAMANAYEAGAANLPFAVLRGYIGVDLPKVNEKIKSVTCPYTGEKLATVPAHRPDVGIIHAQRADKEGNVLIEGITGCQKEVVLASKRTIVTVEEVVEMRSGQKATSERKFFPGYVLVEMDMDEQSWHLVKNTPKVTGFVGGTATKPTPISDKEVQNILQQIQEGVEKPRPKVLDR